MISFRRADLLDHINSEIDLWWEYNEDLRVVFLVWGGTGKIKPIKEWLEKDRTGMDRFEGNNYYMVWDKPVAPRNAEKHIRDKTIEGLFSVQRILDMLGKNGYEIQVIKPSGFRDREVFAKIKRI